MPTHEGFQPTMICGIMIVHGKPLFAIFAPMLRRGLGGFRAFLFAFFSIVNQAITLFGFGLVFGT